MESSSTNQVGEFKEKVQDYEEGVSRAGGRRRERDNYVQLQTCCGVWNFMVARTLVNSPWRPDCMHYCYFKAAGLVKVVEG